MDACRGEELEGLTGSDRAFFVSARYEEGFLNSEGGELTLALSRKRKEQLVEQYAEQMARAQVAIWSRFEGISVEEFDDLRHAVREGHGAKVRLLAVAVACHLLLAAGYLAKIEPFRVALAAVIG